MLNLELMQMEGLIELHEFLCIKSQTPGTP